MLYCPSEVLCHWEVSTGLGEEEMKERILFIFPTGLGQGCQGSYLIALRIPRFHVCRKQSKALSVEEMIRNFPVNLAFPFSEHPIYFYM